METFIDLTIALGISVGINMLFFIIAFNLKKDLFTDITYASSFLITSIIVMLINKSYGINAIIALTLVALWSLRLGTFLFIRILKEKVDHRFDEMRGSFKKFGLFWFSQSILVFIISIPVYFIIIFNAPNFSLYSLIGIILAGISLTWETIADLQKYRWNLVNKGKFINKGLWSVSRHPNYFGEYTFWTFVFIFSMISSYSDIHWVGIISPIFITFILYKATGVPMLEKIGWKRFGSQQSYVEYLKNTSCVVPFVGKKGIKENWKK